MAGIPKPVARPGWRRLKRCFLASGGFGDTVGIAASAAAPTRNAAQANAETADTVAVDLTCKTSYRGVHLGVWSTSMLSLITPSARRVRDVERISARRPNKDTLRGLTSHPTLLSLFPTDI